MTLIRIGLAAAAAVIWHSPCQSQAVVDPRGLARHLQVSAALTVLDSWVAARVALKEQPGLSIGVVYDQDLIWAKGYGFADLEHRVPATPSTTYRIASISKLFTATAIMQLRDAGKLRLDDPLTERLPWFRIQKTHSGGPPITIRHLITHTSGLPREVTGVSWSDVVFPTREEMRRVLPGQATVYAPERTWKYSNLAVSLAGEVVAQVSGEPWGQYVERHILQPLGMRATQTNPVRGMPGLARGYLRRVPGQARSVEAFADMGAESPAASLASNVEDLAKFIALQFRADSSAEASVLAGTSLAEMHRVHWLRPDWKGGWGLGFSIRRVGEQVRIGHGGSLPGYRTQIEIAPADKLGVIVLTNADDGLPLDYVEQAFRLITPAVAKALARPDSAAVPDPSWRRYTGRYAWKFSEMQIQILDGRLTMIVPEDENPWESRVILEPAGLHAFRMTAPGFTYGPVGELLTFEMDPGGRVVRVSGPGRHWLPIREDSRARR